MHSSRPASENAAAAAGPVLFGKGHDHSAPGQVVAENHRGNRVRDALLGAFDHVGREVLVTTRRRVVGEFGSLFRHGNTGCGLDGAIGSAEARAEGARATSSSSRK